MTEEFLSFSLRAIGGSLSVIKQSRWKRHRRLGEIRSDNGHVVLLSGNIAVRPVMAGIVQTNLWLNNAARGRSNPYVMLIICTEPERNATPLSTAMLYYYLL
jgi:hypothetical protein